MANTSIDLTIYKQYFDSNKFWAILKKSAENLGRTTVKQVLILYYMYQDGLNLPEKMLVLGALGYLIFPLDMIPDAIPFLGWSDDITAIAYVWNKLKDKATPEARAKAESKIAEWF